MHHKGQGKSSGSSDSSRELVWVERANAAGWGCSDCAWVFAPSTSIPKTESLQELLWVLDQQLREMFETHSCALRQKNTLAS